MAFSCGDGMGDFTGIFHGSVKNWALLPCQSVRFQFRLMRATETSPDSSSRMAQAMPKAVAQGAFGVSRKDAADGGGEPPHQSHGGPGRVQGQAKRLTRCPSQLSLSFEPFCSPAIRVELPNQNMVCQKGPVADGLSHRWPTGEDGSADARGGAG